MKFQIIKSPTPATVEMLLRRRAQKGGNSWASLNLSAIGLVQGLVLDMFKAADVAQKAADVHVEEITGLCPQHFTMIAVIGDTAAVETALEAVKAQVPGNLGG